MYSRCFGQDDDDNLLDDSDYEDRPATGPSRTRKVGYPGRIVPVRPVRGVLPPPPPNQNAACYTGLTSPNVMQLTLHATSPNVLRRFALGVSN